ncbi:MAG: thiamine pyrophosphate-binding protein [Candidatus Thorarchaeota archaeon]
MMKGAESLYNLLRDYGVKYLFGMDSPESLYQEIHHDEIRPITVRDERSAAHMADGFARVSYRPGICTAIHGPGVTNLITGIAEAYASCIPMIGLVSAVDSNLLGKHSIQEIDQVSLLRPITKWVTRVESPDHIPDMIRKAFRTATTGKPGPVVLNLTYTALENEQTENASTTMGAEPEYSSIPAARVAPDSKLILRAAEMLLEAKNPCIIAGGGVILSRACNELMQLAEHLVIPVATTMLGKGAIPDNHYLSIGVTGYYTDGIPGRGRIANRIVKESDTVLLIGTQTEQPDTADWTIPDPESTIIHIDVDANEIGRNYPTALGIVADAKLALSHLLNKAKDKVSKEPSEYPRVKQIEELLQEWRDAISPEWNSQKAPINPQRVMKELQEFIDRKSILVADASYSSLWALSHIDFPISGRRFVAPRGLGVVGSGLPLAMGVKLASPEKRVMCLTGDGGFGYSYPELETAARYEIPVVVLILNNQTLGFLKHYEKVLYGKSVECDFLDANYASIANALKCDGTRIENPDEIHEAIKSALATKRPSVIDLIVDPDIPGPMSLFDSLQ